MFNPYIITLSLFVIASLLVTTWAWLSIAKARKRLKWPTVEGVIKESKPDSIIFSYSVKEQIYTHTMDLQTELSPALESSDSHQNKYPQGEKVVVFYQPDNPENGTIGSGLGNDDWLIFALGTGSTLLGIIFLFFS